MNLDTVRRVRDYVAGERQPIIDMREWLGFGWREGRDEEEPLRIIASHNAVDYFAHNRKDLEPCGTTCCVAGAVWLSSPERRGTLHQVTTTADLIRLVRETQDIDVRTDAPSALQAFATRDLGLDGAEAPWLFFLYNWPEKYIHTYCYGGNRNQALLDLLDDILAEKLELTPDGWYAA